MTNCRSRMTSRRVVSRDENHSSRVSLKDIALTVGLVASGVSMNMGAVEKFEEDKEAAGANQAVAVSAVPEVTGGKLIGKTADAVRQQTAQKAAKVSEEPVVALPVEKNSLLNGEPAEKPELGLEISSYMKEIEERNRKFTERFEKMVSENFEERYTERENAVLRRRKQTFADIFAGIRNAESEVLQIRNLHKLLTPEQRAEAMKDPTTLLLRVSDPGTGTSSAQPLRFTPEKYKLVTDFVHAIEEEGIEEFARIDPSARELIALKHDPAHEQEYLLGVFYRLARRSPAFHHWIFEELDENHPLYNFDGSLDRSKLPSEAWTAVELKGGGEVPILKADLPLFPTLADRWFFNKVSKATPLDRRFMAKEFDMQGDGSRVGMIIKIVQNAVERYWQMVRPADKDKAYYFDLEEDVPYDGTKAVLKSNNAKYSNYHLTRELAQLLFVPPKGRLLRCDKRQQCINMALNIKHLKSFAASGGDLKQDDFEDPDAKQQ